MTEKRITKELYDTLEYLQENNQINDANLIDFIVQSEIDHKNTEAIQTLIRATKTYKADKRYTRDLTSALTTLRKLKREQQTITEYLKEKNFIDDTTATTIKKCHKYSGDDFNGYIGALVDAVNKHKQSPSEETAHEVTEALMFFEELSNDREALMRYGFIEDNNDDEFIEEEEEAEKVLDEGSQSDQEHDNSLILYPIDTDIDFLSDHFAANGNALLAIRKYYDSTDTDPLTLEAKRRIDQLREDIRRYEEGDTSVKTSINEAIQHFKTLYSFKHNKSFPSTKQTMQDEFNEESILFDQEDVGKTFDQFDVDDEVKQYELGAIDPKKFKHDYTYNDENHIDFMAKSQIGKDYDDFLKDKNQNKKSFKRADRTYDKVKKEIDGLHVPNLTQTRDLAKYRQALLDTVINGNLRIKFVAKAATRDLAKEYVESHLDENGIPMYRLLPTNSTDPLGNKITDLNGDGVDDIVLVDRRGSPVIVNGYKLVAASPYKKVWASIHKTREARKQNPFNLWLYSMYNKNIMNVDWDKGEWKMEPKEEMSTLISAYKEVGLPKPRIGKRLSPTSYWASVFSPMWKIFWTHFPKLEPLKALVKYVNAANILFIIYFDIPAKKDIEQNRFNGKQLDYEEWVTVRKLNKPSKETKTYYQIVGGLMNDFIQNDLATAVEVQTGQINQEDIKQWSQNLKRMFDKLVTIVFNYHLGYDVVKQEDALNNWAEAILRKKVDTKALSKQIDERLLNAIDKLYGGCGYAEYKKKKDTEKEEKKANAKNIYKQKYKLTS